MDPVISAIIEAMRAHLPPVFLGSLIDGLTDGTFCWRTICNRRCRHEIPDECFFYAGRKVLVRRDPFLEWWATTLTTERPAMSGCSVVPRKAVASVGEHPTQKSEPRSRRSTAMPTKSSVGSPTCAVGNTGISMEQE